MNRGLKRITVCGIQAEGPHPEATNPWRGIETNITVKMQLSYGEWGIGCAVCGY